jgi:hypothetical protein
MPLIDEKDGRLVTLKPGRYFTAYRNGEIASFKIQFDEPTTALLLECQGKKAWNSEETCWHALVDGDVILVWDDNFTEGER